MLACCLCPSQRTQPNRKLLFMKLAFCTYRLMFSKGCKRRFLVVWSTFHSCTKDITKSRAQQYKCPDTRFLATCQCPWTRWFWGAGLDHCRVQLTSICFEWSIFIQFCCVHRDPSPCCGRFVLPLFPNEEGVSRGGSDVNAYPLLDWLFWP